MPRATRRSLAKEESIPTRSSPRASTKASSAAAGSPAKTRGRRSEKVEEDVKPTAAAEPEEPVEKRGRERPTSRGRGAKTAGRHSQSRGRGASGDEGENEEEKMTPPSASKRGGRGKVRAEAAPQEEEAKEPEQAEEKEEEEEEVPPKSGRGRRRGRGHGKSPAAAAPSRGGRSSRRSGAGEGEAAAEEAEKPEKDEKTTPTRGRGRGRGASSRSRSRPGRGGNKDVGEEATEEMDVSTTADADEKVADAEPTAGGEAEVPRVEAEAKKANFEPAASGASAPKPAAKPMEQEGGVTESKPDVNNGDVTDKPESKKLTGVKRKLEEEATEAKAETDQLDAKQARVNGEGADDTSSPAKTTDAAASQQESSSATASGADSEIPDDFVVVNKEDVPAADSAEVAAALPPPAAVAAGEPMDTSTPVAVSGGVASGSSTVPMTVVPLTEAELAKAYANEIQAKEREDRDEVSSIVVEVGSVAGSDITGGTCGLDTSEIQSGSNSIDGDFPGDTSITEGQLTSESSAKPTTCQQQVPVNPTAVLNDNRNNTDTVEVAQGQIETAIGGQASVPVANAAASQGNAAVVQNSVCPPSNKSSSSVSERLGTPDPAFLVKYSSPNIFTRIFVPNPVVPADTVDSAHTFSVVSYNILAECARQRGDYSYTAPEFLGQEYRHGLLMKELQYLNSDVVCLQEVNPAYFNTVLLPDMRKLGYDGTMIKRTKEYFDEGEATFYRTTLFDLESSKGVSLTDIARKEVEAGGLQPEVGAAINKYLDRADVVLITKLCHKATGKSFTVGNIHVVWDHMESPDVQCIQAACAIKEVVGVAGGEGAPHIICGDFNSEWNSPAYQLVVDGYLSDTSIHKLQAVEHLELSEGSKSLVNHLWRAFQHTSSNLRSAYSTVTGSEPEVTTFTSSMCNTVDYVFFSSGSLMPVGVLKTVDKAVVDATRGLPDREFPSDHLSMKTVMAFTN